MTKLSMRLIFVCVSVIGIWLIPTLNVSLFPPINHQTLRITTNWPNSTKFAVEREITSKFEGILSSVRGIEKIISKSFPGYSEIEVEINEEEILSKIRFQISSLLRQRHAQLPLDVSYPSVDYTSKKTDELILLEFGIIPNGIDLVDLNQHFTRTVMTEISKVPGVAKIQLDGVPRKSIEVQYDMDAMQRLNVTKEDLIHSLELKTHSIHLGEINDSDNHHFKIFYEPNFTVNKLRTSIVKQTKNNAIYLDNIARLREFVEEGSQRFRINGISSLNLVHST